MVCVVRLGVFGCDEWGVMCGVWWVGGGGCVWLAVRCAGMSGVVSAVISGCEECSEKCCDE